MRTRDIAPAALLLATLCGCSSAVALTNGDVRPFVIAHAQDIQVDYDPIDPAGPTEGEADQVWDAVLEGRVVAVSDGVTVSILNSSASDDPDGVGDPDNGGAKGDRPAVEPWLHFTAIDVLVSRATDATLEGRTVTVQLQRGPLVGFSTVAELAVGSDVVFIVSELPPYHDDPGLVVGPEGTSLDGMLSPLPDGAWFDGPAGPVSPFATLEELPASWGDPETLDDIAELFGLGQG
jgi:hypothetical protein